jgi:hypothetical protein
MRRPSNDAADELGVLVLDAPRPVGQQFIANTFPRLKTQTRYQELRDM